MKVPGTAHGMSTSIAYVERWHIEETLRATPGKIKGGGAAELLGLLPSTLYSRMRRLAIQSPSR